MIDYRIPEFTFIVGTFNVTAYLASFTVSSPHLEINTSAEWSGEFELDYNLVGIWGGLTENDFDPLGSPLRWRPGLSAVSITIRGYSLPKFRIEGYAYNPQTRKGQGRLVQILALLSARDAPSSEPDIRIETGKPIVDVVVSLLNHAFVGTPLSPNLALNTIGMVGSIYSPIVTRKPAQDAQKLAGISWRWLTVGLNEEIGLFNASPSSNAVLFSRSLRDVEWDPDLDNLHFAAPKVIVTGSCQIPDPISCPVDPNPAADGGGRPQKVVTETYMPFGQIFPQSGTSTTPTLSQRKTIYYGYNKSIPGTVNYTTFLNIIGRFADGVNYAIGMGGDISEAGQRDTRDYDGNTPIAVQTVTEEPAGKIFPSLGTNVNMYPISVTVETPFVRSEYVPDGIVFPQLGTSFNLILTRREVLVTERVPLKPTHGGAIDPRTGKPTCYEATPLLEQTQPVAQNPLKTVVIRGEAVVIAPNWTPLNPVPHIEEVGFLPSETHAIKLAQNIALREQYRRDAVQLTMQIPIEWLAAGCPPGFKMLCHDGEFWCDAIIISIQGEAKFSCSAARIAKLTNIIQPQPPIAPYIPTGSPQLLTPDSATGTIGTPFLIPILIGGL